MHYAYAEIGRCEFLNPNFPQNRQLFNCMESKPEGSSGIMLRINETDTGITCSG